MRDHQLTIELPPVTSGRIVSLACAMGQCPCSFKGCEHECHR